MKSEMVKHLGNLAGGLVRVGAGSFLLLFTWLLTDMASVQAQDATSVFFPPAAPLTAGQPGSVWLGCLNNSANPITHAFDPLIPATLTSTSGTNVTLLQLNTNNGAMTVMIPPGGFAKAEYRLDVPAGLGGQVTLTAGDFNPVVLLVAAGSASGTLTASPPAPAPAPTSPSTNILTQIDSRLSPYEPIYFILGTYPAAEFQFSIKYKLFNFAENWNPLGHLYFAYTQTSYWDLISSDPSFYDSSYKPSAFLYYTNVLHKDFFHLDLQPGVEHESNGRGGTLERSLYTAYLQPTATFDLPRNFTLTLQPRAWAYLDVGANNPDIDAYRGYGDLRTALTWTDPGSGEKIQFATKLETGDTGDHDAFQFDLRFNLAGVPVLDTFNPTIQVEYFTGYGQTLRQYNQKSHGLRAGLCLWY